MVAKYCYLFLPGFCLWRKFASKRITFQFILSKVAFIFLGSISSPFFYGCYGTITFPLLSFCQGTISFPSYLFVRRLYPLSSCLFIRGLSPLPCSMVDFLAAWSKSFLVASFVIKSGTGVLTFWGGFIRLCSDLGVFFLLNSDLGVFSVWLCVLCSMGHRLLTDYFICFEGLEFQLCFLVFDLGIW